MLMRMQGLINEVTHFQQHYSFALVAALLHDTISFQKSVLILTLKYYEKTNLEKMHRNTYWTILCGFFLLLYWQLFIDLQ